MKLTDAIAIVVLLQLITYAAGCALAMASRIPHPEPHNPELETLNSIAHAVR